MNDPQTGVPVVQYSAPRVYFDRPYHYRNRWMPLAIVVLLGMGIAFLLASRAGPRPSGAG